MQGIFPGDVGSRAKPQDNESLRDLVNNLTNLALAITEDRNREPGAEAESEPEQDTQRYERKFGSLEKKLKRTNLMKRRESQALLDGLRKTRSSSGLLSSKPSF